MKKILSILTVLLLLFSLAACSSTPKEKVFSKSGFEITLTSAFQEKSVSGYTACYASSKAAVLILKEDFSLFEGAGDLTLAEYAELVREANSAKFPSETKSQDGLTYFEFSFYNSDEQVTYEYFVAMYKGGGAFWTVQFASPDTMYDEQRPTFITWAKSFLVK